MPSCIISFFLIFTVRLFFSVTGEAETVYLLLNSVTENFLGDNEIIFLMKGTEIKIHSYNFILKVKLFKFHNVFVLFWSNVLKDTFALVSFQVFC